MPLDRGLTSNVTKKLVLGAALERGNYAERQRVPPVTHSRDSRHGKPRYAWSNLCFRKGIPCGVSRQLTGVKELALQIPECSSPFS